MATGKENSQLFPSSSNWNITKQSFLPQEVPQKLIRAWDRVPVVAQVGRFQGNTVWKKAATRKYGTSKEIEDVVLRELDANGKTARKRIKGSEHRSCILDALWADIPQLDAQESLIPAMVEPADVLPVIEEVRGTFPPLHFVPRKRTHANEIITPPKELEQELEAHISQEAKMLVTTEVVNEEEKKPARRRKSARMSMANRRITLGAPNLGLDSPLRSTPKFTPSKGTPSRATPMKIFQSAGGGSAEPKKLEFRTTTLANDARRTTIAGANELPILLKTAVRRSLRNSIGGLRKSLIVLPNNTLAFELNSVKTSHAKENGETQITNDSATEDVQENLSEVDEVILNPRLSTTEEIDSGKLDISSPKRKRFSSPEATPRKSSRLSMLSRSLLPGHEEDGDAKVSEPSIVVKKDAQTVTSVEKINEECEDDPFSEPRKGIPKLSPKRWTEAPDLFGTTPSSQKERYDLEGHGRSSISILRSPTRRSTRDLSQEHQHTTSKVHVLISIKSIHVANIHCGLKTHEFRAYKLPEETRYLWIYETAPKQCITHVANIGPAKAPGQIDEIGLGNIEFNSGKEKSYYAYEILQLYELKNELPLSALLEKQYAKGPPQKYSFANQKMLNEVSLLEDVSLVFDKNTRDLTVSANEAPSLENSSSADEATLLVPLDIQTEEATSATEENAKESDEMLIPAQSDSIQEEVAAPVEEIAAKEHMTISGSHSSPEQKGSLRLRSLSPAFEDLLAVHSAENQSLLLSPVKDEDNKLSKLSPIQLGNILLRELDGEDSSLSSMSPSSPMPDGSASDITKDNLNAASSLSPHDDTSMLEDFVTRVRASRAANVQDQTKFIAKSSVPQSPTRNPLAKVDSNHSPSLQKTSSHIGRHKTGIIEAQSSLKSDKAKRLRSPLRLVNEDEEPPTTRRSARSRTPVKGTSNISSLPVPISAPSTIPLRRHGGPGEVLLDANSVLKQKVDKKLAASTRINTLKNTGPNTVKKFLALQAAEAGDTLPELRSLKSSKSSGKKKATVFKAPIEEPIEEATQSVKEKLNSTKRKSVMWAEELVQYQDEEKDKLVEVKKPVKVGVGSVRSAASGASSSALTSKIAIDVASGLSSTASKIAIGMGISGASAANLVPNLALVNEPTPTSIPTASASAIPSASKGTMSTGIPSAVSKAKKAPAGNKGAAVKTPTKPKPKPSRIAAATSTSAVAAKDEVKGTAKDATKGTAKPKSRSRIGLGMTGNGTPAPRKLRPKP